MKSLAAIVAAALLVTAGTANAGEVVVKPKPPGSALVLTMSGGKIVDATAVDAATTGEIVIKPKSSDSAVVLTISGGKLVKASIRAKPEPEPMGEPAPVKDTVVFARAP
jgi:hypothetical protein